MYNFSHKDDVFAAIATHWEKFAYMMGELGFSGFNICLFQRKKISLEPLSASILYHKTSKFPKHKCETTYFFATFNKKLRIFTVAREVHQKTFRD